MNAKRFDIAAAGAAVLLMLVLHGAVYGQSASELVARGNRLYQAGSYDQALDAYQALPPEKAEDAVVLYNRANCLYRQEDYAGAIALYEQASVTSKDIKLVERCRYNLGNCHFQEAQKQLDSDLKKAMEALTESVRHYRAALDIDPRDAEAARNIAVTRLVMKDLLDKLKQQEQQQQQQNQVQELARQIQELIERQEALRTQTAQTQAAQQAGAEQQAQEFGEQATEQEALRQDTGKAQHQADQLQQQIGSTASTAGADPNAQAQQQQQAQALGQAAQELGQAIGQEQQAVEHLQAAQGPDALQAQDQSGQSLQRALDALGKPQPQEQQQQQQQDGSSQDQQQQQEEQQQEQPAQDKQEQKDQQKGQDQQQQQQASAPDTTAKQIIDDERQRKEQRRRPGSGGYQAVDKDW